MNDEWKTSDELPEIGEVVLITDKNGFLGAATVSKDKNGNLCLSPHMFVVDEYKWHKIPDDITEFPKSLQQEAKREREEREKHIKEIQERAKKRHSSQVKEVADKLLASGMDAETVKDVINRL